jgi:hypothetical protein
MGKLDKIISKFKDPKSVIVYNELEYLLGQIGYLEKKTGKTSGSRKAFIHPKTKHIIRIHKPHPGNELKSYVKEFIITELIEQGLL